MGKVSSKSQDFDFGAIFAQILILMVFKTFKTECNLFFLVTYKFLLVT